MAIPKGRADFHVARSWRSYDFYFNWQDPHSRTMTFARELVVESMSIDDERIHDQQEPFLRLSLDDAQQLADALWQAGVRPVQSLGSSGEIGAVRSHLEDMRQLAFAKAEVTKPEKDRA